LKTVFYFNESFSKKNNIQTIKKTFVVHQAVHCDITCIKDTQFFEEPRKILRASLEIAWMGSDRLSLPVTLPLFRCETSGNVDNNDG
jgi:hypothetical protein